MEEEEFWYPQLNHIKNNINSNSWFDISECSNPNTINYDSYFDDNTDTVIRTRKIRIFPTFEQKQILQTWFNDFIDMYNKTNEYIKTKIYDENGNLIKDNFKLVDFRNIRDTEIMYNYKTELADISKINKQILSEAIHLNVSMYKSCITRYLNKDITKFNLNNISKNKRRKNLIIESNLISKNKNKNGFCITILKEMKTENNFYFNSINRTFKLQYDKLYNTYHLLVPFDIRKVDNGIKLINGYKLGTKNPNKISNKICNNVRNRFKKNNKCAIDGGVRTFLTIYSKEKTLEIGTNHRDFLDYYYKKIDKLNKLKSLKKISKLKYKKCISKLNEKIINKISDMHWKASSYLCRNYNTIHIGKLNTKSIVKNGKSNINEKTKRMLYSLSHYKFRMILKSQCEKYNCNYEEINEYETSKRCHKCNEKNNVGSSKTYKCEHCNIELDRDINASINIYKK